MHVFRTRFRLTVFYIIVLDLRGFNLLTYLLYMDESNIVRQSSIENAGYITLSGIESHVFWRNQRGKYF